METVIKHPEAGEVTLSRTRRSSRIALSVRPDGRVRLSFPLWVTQRRALNFLDEKAEWIVAARRKMAERYPDRQPGSDPANNPSPLDKQAAKRAMDALRADAKAKLPLLTARLAAKHGFRHGTVKIKATKSRWGSCTSRGDINLSLSLAALPDHLAEYIVLHELCHTVHHNHSRKFHALLDSVTGGRSKALNRELKGYRPDTVALAYRSN